MKPLLPQHPANCPTLAMGGCHAHHIKTLLPNVSGSFSTDSTDYKLHLCTISLMMDDSGTIQILMVEMPQMMKAEEVVVLMAVRLGFEKITRGFCQNKIEASIFP